MLSGLFYFYRNYERAPTVCVSVGHEFKAERNNT